MENTQQTTRELTTSLQAPYTLRREDNKAARFYWLKEAEKQYKKYIGITSLGDKVVPKSEDLFAFKLLKDPDGRLLELATDFGTIFHLCADALDTGNEWMSFIPAGYRYERGVFGSMLSWHKLKQDYKADILASEMMLKYENPRNPEICFAATLDKVLWMTETQKVKEIQQVEKTVYEDEPDGVFVRGDKKGQTKYKKVKNVLMVDKEVTVEKEVPFLAIIDLKSNFFDKDKKSFFEAHQFQLWGQRLAFMQTFPDLPAPRIFNFSPNSWRVRNGNYDNLYTLKEWKEDYSADFNEYLQKAHRKGYLVPTGRIEVFHPFDAATPLEQAYSAFTYDEFIEYAEANRAKLAEENKDRVFKNGQE